MCDQKKCFMFKNLKIKTMSTMKGRMLRRTLWIGAIAIAIGGMTACNGQAPDEHARTGEEAVRMQLPDSLGMSRDTLRSRVAELTRREVEAEESKLVAEAMAAIADTRRALEAIAKADKEEALAQLERAVGKLEVLLARDPELAEVPISVDARQVELITDLEGLKKLKKAVKEAIKEDQYQTARQLLEGMANEVVITITKIPLGIYPDAMRVAARYVEEGDFDMAALTIGEALKALIVKEIIVPLPILRAEVLLEQAQSLLEQPEAKALVLQLLDNAQYQLVLAEEMGYGRRDEEFANLAKAIKEIRRGVESDQEVVSHIDTLLQVLRRFKERIIDQQ